MPRRHPVGFRAPMRDAGPARRFGSNVLPAGRAPHRGGVTALSAVSEASVYWRRGAPTNVDMPWGLPVHHRSAVSELTCQLPRSHGGWAVLLLTASCTVLGVAVMAVLSCGNDGVRPGRRGLPRGFERSSSMRALGL